MSGVDQANIKKLQDHQNYARGRQGVNPKMEAPPVPSVAGSPHSMITDAKLNEEINCLYIWR